VRAQRDNRVVEGALVGVGPLVGAEAWRDDLHEPDATAALHRFGQGDAGDAEGRAVVDQSGDDRSDAADRRDGMNRLDGLGGTDRLARVWACGIPRVEAHGPNDAGRGRR
jgi:hypothetical protein